MSWPRIHFLFQELNFHIMENKFYQRIKELRQDKNMNQRDFAKLLNVSQGALSRWECNENTPGLEILFQIAKIPDISADYLIGLTDEL